MAHTPEQRDRMPLCGARRKNGELCRAFAGQGTNHSGIGRCKFHGGSTRNHQKHAIMAEAQQRMIKFGAPIEIAPHEALLSMLYLATGHTAWLREEISATDDMSTFEAKVLVTLYGEERDRVAKVAKAAIDAGVAERQVRLAEQYGHELATMLRAIFSDPELGLTEAQNKLLPTLLRRHLTPYDARPALVA